MERFLVALDNKEISLKSISYLARILKGSDPIHLTLCHVLPTASPNILTKEEVQRITRVHEEHPRLRGLYWVLEDEDKMNEVFHKATEILVQAGFSPGQISRHFRVHSGEVAPVILDEAKHLNCSTIVLGRRGLSRFREFLWGSVSRTVARLSRDITVWIVDS